MLGIEGTVEHVAAAIRVASVNGRLQAICNVCCVGGAPYFVVLTVSAYSELMPAEEFAGIEVVGCDADVLYTTLAFILAAVALDAAAGT